MVTIPVQKDLNIRIIARLDIKGPNLVKGINMEGLRVLGKPEEFARQYSNQGIDELFYQDAVASLYGRNNLLEIVEKTSREIFVPLCVGGGLRNLEDIRSVLRAGADKVAINTAAIQNPELIKEASKTFGSSTIVVAIDAVEVSKGEYHALTDYGREITDIDVVDWAQKVVEMGCGEIMLTSINQEGMGTGFDCDLTKKIAEKVDVPVIAGGGCGKPKHVVDVIQNGHADAVAIAAALHYKQLFLGNIGQKTDQYKEEGNLTFLKGGAQHSFNDCFEIKELKETLKDQNISCRMAHI